jgi:hypothetical protein
MEAQNDPRLATSIASVIQDRVFCPYDIRAKFGKSPWTGAVAVKIRTTYGNQTERKEYD